MRGIIPIEVRSEKDRQNHRDKVRFKTGNTQIEGIGINMILPPLESQLEFTRI